MRKILTQSKCSKLIIFCLSRSACKLNMLKGSSSLYEYLPICDVWNIEQRNFSLWRRCQFSQAVMCTTNHSISAVLHFVCYFLSFAFYFHLHKVFSFHADSVLWEKVYSFRLLKIDTICLPCLDFSEREKQKINRLSSL